MEANTPEAGLPIVTEEEWVEFDRSVDTFEAQHITGKAKFAFAFVEGPLVKAIREGHWYVNTSLSKNNGLLTPLGCLGCSLTKSISLRPKL